MVAGGQAHGDHGHLGPANEALLIAQIVEILGVLVVGQAHRVGAHLANKAQVLAVHRGREGVSHTGAVLVARYASQRVGTAVQEEAVARGLHGAAAKADALLVAGCQAGAQGVEVGVVQAVPQVDFGEKDVGAGAAVCGDRGLKALTCDFEGHDLVCGCALDPSLKRDLGRAGL